MAEAVTKSDPMTDVKDPVRHAQWETGEIAVPLSTVKTTVAFDVRGFADFILTVDNDRTGSDSTDLDTHVYTSPDGVVFDTEPYVSISTLGAGKVESLFIDGPVNYMKIGVDNQDGANATVVKLTVIGAPQARGD